MPQEELSYKKTKPSPPHPNTFDKYDLIFFISVKFVLPYNAKLCAVKYLSALETTDECGVFFKKKKKKSLVL